ncbi:ribosome biogenesis GTPase YlqF [Agrilactobacillus yilanensis]|uniref:Ribosome biogenesis GTPase A n=1 Tax=Agrilactobacillus yilanensis TaxID=2485997 RepID=A0ABW4J7D5_9LACO|nr:ribosome biogenesis GTPase YlqF [Agrilactobacillus yilanensis]
MSTIQWFPGHMAKARNQVQEKLKLVDIVLEIVDARIPISSQNPMLAEIIEHKPKIMILNKADLADPKQTEVWQAYFKQQGYASIAIDAQHKSQLPQINKVVRTVLKDKIQKQYDKGLKLAKVRAICIGIPNVGKSTILNRLVHKNIAKTGDRPGVTKNQQWLKVNEEFEVLDTPGILWPKFEDQTVGTKLALLGSIKDSIYADDDVALFALDYLKTHYAPRLLAAYKLNEADLDQDNPDLMLFLTKKLGFKEDYDQFAQRLILDIRKGRFGRLTFEDVVLATDTVGD